MPNYSFPGLFPQAANKCPRNLALMFHKMRMASVARFPEDEKVAWTSISGLVFLRFFVPALRVRLFISLSLLILQEPRKFGLIDKVPSPNAERNFIIVATILQKLANIKNFDSDQVYWNLLDRWFFENTRVMQVRIIRASAHHLIIGIHRCHFNQEESRQAN